ncbi:hypothetical protein [Streptomyces sp. NPDC005435]|uniref:hypothetical protein n=1 Tax=Streptomyces sp. NPDC005435 TaxID=3154464 RepID=UPI003451343F
MNRKLRLTAASVVAAVALGFAAPAADAATQHRPAPVAATQTIQTGSNAQARSLVTLLRSEGITAHAVGQTSAVAVEGGYGTQGTAGVVLKAWKLLKKVPGAVKWSGKVARKAYSLGKTKGVAYLKKQVAELSSWSPTKWVWKTILGLGNASTIWDIIQYIIHHT